MKEDFLHYVWKHKKFRFQVLCTTEGESLNILKFGQHNQDAGPDVFNAQVRIADQLWAGNIEIHLKSSDWYLHNHEKDQAYDNVILHVVWEHDTEIFRSDNSTIPTLELNTLVNHQLLNQYQKLMKATSWINCETDFKNVTDFTLNNWLERLYIERLEQKSEVIMQLLRKSNNDWEAVLFKLLAKNFGLKVNSEAFLSLANSVDYALVRKLQQEASSLEALFFGQAKMLDSDIEQEYYKWLQKEYHYLKKKFTLSNDGVVPLKFFRLRPNNFPTIRLSQLASLYATETALFSKIIKLKTKADFYELLSVKTSDFWDSHYTFTTVSKKVPKYLSKVFIDLLIINTVIPFKFTYARYHGKTVDKEIFDLISSLKLESNSITKKFLGLKPQEKNALTSQGLIQLKTEYCNQNRCLHCAVGHQLIIKNG